MNGWPAHGFGSRRGRPVRERAEAKATRIERLGQLLDGAANLLNSGADGRRFAAK